MKMAVVGLVMIILGVVAFGSPATTTGSGPGRFAKWNKECEDRVAAAKGKCDVIFIGDSITVQWLYPKVGKKVWDKYYSKREALNFGVGGDRTQHVLWRLENMKVKDLKPKVAVLLIGTNNYSDKATDIADGVKADIAKIREIFKDVKVIVVSITPNGRSKKGVMEAANKTIETFADGKDVFYLDLAAKMPRVQHGWKGVGGDGLHLSTQGYEMWAEEMEPLMTKFLAAK